MDINGRCFQRVVVDDVDNEYYSGDVTHVYTWLFCYTVFCFDLINPFKNNA